MKQKAKNYAAALVDSLATVKPGREKSIVANFLKLLEANGDMKKAKEIIALAEGLFLKKTGNKKIVLETARPLNSRSVFKKIKKEGDIIEEKINPELIAGIKIIVNNSRQLDFSLRKKLQQIFQ
ncbi:MAG: hypothetical protein A3A98_01315 [Candidatus Staskawiczbacteria bacterium RIFCSPLOWO2_01_FULL_40_39]|uniref:Uncharacterized protein n=1 Tax=Candidatus Staskawiczbacteria bacterium RIFCSPHIGHO2_01_FULL_39_25 TaxID=1802202 RepID=A0A1G2HNE0_9BACT|nr:MAG: hypothetical protein A2730_01315 [Candidatus Staskawiczbacteria bacterium RIFCSPHIGHO2_01_FULL_39_25]OGZ73367.1 MAG: hypothetical protein A3A98_01315 [Candidatus Staskawiczbacteria bacterium RIFCSPLOWO2_01_FULL_40_39]OGZ75969.1 MAG: hypothetical protein A3I87_02405 [Candidatus Staskawiczbacteria bacterium RIFCSPLOWO2_02_FULL_39_8]